MTPSLCHPPRLTKSDFIALARDRMLEDALDWPSRFYLAGMVTLAASPVVYVGVLAGATAAGCWGL
jgi:hypothetical protein